MGLLDNLDDPQKQALLAMGLGLLAPKQSKTSFLQDVGQSGLMGLQTYSQARTAERANRQNELQQVAGTYKVLKDLDQQSQLGAALDGRPYTPNPMLAQMESRLNTLVGGHPMQTNIGASPQPQTAAPSSPPQLPPSSPPGMAPPSQSPMADPNYQPPMVRPPMPQQGPQNAPQATQGAQPNLGQLADMAGVPKPVAFGLIAANKPEELMKLIAKGFEVRGSGGNFMRISPKTGGMEFLGGQVQPNSFPVVPGEGGGLKTLPIQGLNEAIAAQTEAKTNAEEGAKAKYDTITVPRSDGSSVTMPRSKFLGLDQQSQLPSFPPGVAKVTVTEPSRAPSAGALGVSQSTAQKTAAETNPKLQAEYIAKSYDENSKANDSLQFLHAQKQALKDGAFTGAMSKPELLVARFGAAFNIGPQDKVVDSETFMSMAGRSVMGSIKSLGSGSGISDSDREFAAKAMGGSLALNQETLNRLLDIQEKAVHRGIDLHNKRVDQASKSGMPSMFDYHIEPIPARQSAQPAQAAPGNVRRYNPQTGRIE